MHCDCVCVCVPLTDKRTRRSLHTSVRLSVCLSVCLCVCVSVSVCWSAMEVYSSGRSIDRCPPVAAVQSQPPGRARYRLTHSRSAAVPDSRISHCIGATSIGQRWRLPHEKKLLMGHRPVRSWTRRTISKLFLCRTSHSFLGKSTKTAAARAALFDSNMHQIAPPDPLAVFRGPTSKGAAVA